MLTNYSTSSTILTAFNMKKCVIACLCGLAACQESGDGLDQQGEASADEAFVRVQVADDRFERFLSTVETRNNQGLISYGTPRYDGIIESFEDRGFHTHVSLVDDERVEDVAISGCIARARKSNNARDVHLTDYIVFQSRFEVHFVPRQLGIGFYPEWRCNIDDGRIIGINFARD